MEYVIIGKIVNTFGIKGELKVATSTDFIDDRFLEGSSVYVGDDYIEFVVKKHHNHKGFELVTFKDNEDINLVEKYKNCYIYKAKKDIKPLENGEYYFSDLRDLDVYKNNEIVGKVLRVEESIRNNNLRILSNNKEILIPYLPNFIEKVDLENKAIHIQNTEGLLWK